MKRILELIELLGLKPISTRRNNNMNITSFNNGLEIEWRDIDDYVSILENRYKSSLETTVESIKKETTVESIKKESIERKKHIVKKKKKK